ncbi:MAG: ribosomal RNA small subunit methyltransferase A [Mailhella sp.]|nr:ribosomal RNA small subunit methyltransferase A [Mailhella sp.]
MTGRTHAKKSLGQHFLVNRGAIDRIVSLAGIREGDSVLEIGPGPGALTEPLRALPWKRLVLLEKDDAFAAEHASRPMPGLEVRNADALLFPWETLDGEWTILGNLPYNVASPLIWDIVSRVPSLRRAVFMTQKEVAERIRALPGGKTYGMLGAWVQNWCHAQKGLTVGPGSFSPPPKVDSEVFVLTPHGDPPRDPEALARTLKLCFAKRRKQLGGILRPAFPDLDAGAILSGLGIDPNARPEMLSPMQFRALSETLPFSQKN